MLINILSDSLDLKGIVNKTFFKCTLFLLLFVIDNFCYFFFKINFGKYQNAFLLTYKILNFGFLNSFLVTPGM